MGMQKSGFNIKASDLASRIGKILAEYSDDVIEATRLMAQASGKAAREKLEKTSPRSENQYSKGYASEKGKYTGHYAEGWKTTSEYSALGVDVVVYQYKKPGLTHLLENGHANRNGGRTPAYVHIKPVEEEVKQEFEKNLEAVLSNV